MAGITLYYVLVYNFEMWWNTALLEMTVIFTAAKE